MKSSRRDARYLYLMQILERPADEVWARRRRPGPGRSSRAGRKWRWTTAAQVATSMDIWQENLPAQETANCERGGWLGRKRARKPVQQVVRGAEKVRPQRSLPSGRARI